ncbi:hypothetical protein Y695_02960 [Hydrogenophaga sp. T4]|nr:hypothetical protein Y695_02960 [Hydrogenophaga sp. T4]
MGAEQEVAVAVHEVHRGVAAVLPQQLGAGVPEGRRGVWRLGRQHIVTDPDFKEIAQDEQRIGPPCRGLLQIALPQGERGGFRRLQMQVGNEIDRLPVRGCAQGGEAVEGRFWHGDWAGSPRHQMATVRWRRLFQSRRLPWARRHESLCDPWPRPRSSSQCPNRQPPCRTRRNPSPARWERCG